MSRLVIWSGLGRWRAEVAEVELTTGGLVARGTQAGLDPRGGMPYRLDYALEAEAGFVTTRLGVTATGDGWSASLALTRDGDGAWSCARSGAGPPGTPAAGAAPDLDGALDCDLGLSPLTNLMPVRRHGLLDPGPPVEILAAWVAAPELTLHASRQRYEHVRRDGDGDGAVVRYTDLGVHDGITADLLLDADGLVIDYPGVARRVTAPG